MESKHGNICDHVHTVRDQVQRESFKMVKLGKLTQFENEWLDPKTGKIARLSRQAWLVDATEAAGRDAVARIRHAVRSQVKYYRDVANKFDVEFG